MKCSKKIVEEFFDNAPKSKAGIHGPSNPQTSSVRDKNFLWYASGPRVSKFSWPGSGPYFIVLSVIFLVTLKIE